MELFHRTKELTDDINLNLNVIPCDNPSCDIQAHIQYIDALYDKITSCMLNASDKHISVYVNESKPYQIPGSNEVCTDLHSHARRCFLAWRQNNSPRSGSLFLEMKKSRSRFKLALGDCRSDKTRKTADSIINSLQSKNSKEFWKDIKAVTNSHIKRPNVIDGVTGDTAICNMWKNIMNHF